MLVKPLYGLCDVADCWNITLHSLLSLTNYALITLNMISLSSFNMMELVYSECYVLTLTTYSPQLSAFTRLLTSRKSVSRARRGFLTKYIYFAGIHAKRDDENVIHFDQKAHLNLIRELDKDCSFDEFRSRRHSLAWLTQSGSDVCETSKILSQGTIYKFEESHVKRLNAISVHIHATFYLTLRHHRLNENCLHVVAYADSSFSNNIDISSQLGIMFVLTDSSGKVNIMHYSSYKSKRCLLYTSPSPRDQRGSRMPSSA